MARLREALAIAFGACLVPVLLIVAGVMALGAFGNDATKD